MNQALNPQAVHELHTNPALKGLAPYESCYATVSYTHLLVAAVALASFGFACAQDIKEHTFKFATNGNGDHPSCLLYTSRCV